MNKTITVTNGKYQFTVDKNIKDFSLIANVIYSTTFYSAAISCYLKTITVIVYKGTALYSGDIWINIGGIIIFE